ncbi:pseudouridine synthase [Alteromonas sp. BMJM2]|uniref:pseudouridine synthase n=1 Tax=Alteromonas sp. BMJM2 TaxID=2954241 RepID=UPI0022B2DF70|nr:pseudouridine synthase [Alteromonas sp. BMJM2]
MQHIPIIYRGKGIIVVNKPVGVAMHTRSSEHSEGDKLSSHNLHDENTAQTDNKKQFDNSGRQNEVGLESEHSKERIAERGQKLGIVELLKRQLNVPQLYLCHRLDTGTSGCLCLTENEHLAAEIGLLFEARQVSKYYLALSDKKPKKKQGLIIGDMKNRRGGQHILLKTTDNPAITQFFSQSAKQGIRGFLLKPHSGKTHQIRVALKSIGAPILGDSLYGGSSADRLYLHAFMLSLPLKSGTLTFTAPLLEGDEFNDATVKQWLLTVANPDNFAWPALPSRYSHDSSLSAAGQPN